MKKVRKYYFSPDHMELHCEVFIDGKLAMNFKRHMYFNMVLAMTGDVMPDVTTFDLELHAFLRFSHQMIVNPDSLAGEKIEEMFELENPNI